MSSNAVLQVNGVSKRFGVLQALSDVGITINAGQVYGLIGPNGAGKTTFFNVITGLYTPDAGSFMLGGAPYQPTAVHEVAKTGIARTFQNIRLFANLSALENVMIGRHVRTHATVIGAVFRGPRTMAEEKGIARRDCTPCALRPRCTRAKREPRIIGLQEREHFEALQGARKHQGTKRPRHSGPVTLPAPGSRAPMPRPSIAVACAARATSAWPKRTSSTLSRRRPSIWSASRNGSRAFPSRKRASRASPHSSPQPDLPANSPPVSMLGRGLAVRDHS